MKRHRFQRLCLFGVAAAWLVLAPAHAQVDPSADDGEFVDESLPDGSDDLVIPPQEPMTPREELFLAIELRDVDAARKALERGADREINAGVPSPLAAAALHDDLRMIVLLLESGGKPAIARDSPLEEAVRNENTQMVELLMRAGARVPREDAGQELFRLAQRGSAAMELSRILLDHGAHANQCLAAATERGRVELMKYCLRRGADIGRLPAALNPLGVALASDDPEIVDQILAGEPPAGMVIGAFTDAIAAGRTDLVRRALTAGAIPAFEHVEAAIENRHPEIGLYLLDQIPEEDGSVVLSGDIDALIQRASDLGYEEMAAGLKRKTGRSVLPVDGWLVPAVGGLLALGTILLVAIGIRSRRSAGRASAPVPAPRRRSVGAGPGRAAPAGRSDSEPRQRAGRPASEAGARSVASKAPTERLPDAARGDSSPASTVPVGAIPMMPSVAPAERKPAPSAPPVARPEPAAAVPVQTSAPAVEESAGDASSAWQVAPEPAVDEPAAAADIAAVSGSPAPSMEVRMPEVDLSRDADKVFDAARAAGETVRPDAPDRRQIVLVTPARVTMLQSCPAPGSLSDEELLPAQQLAPGEASKNVAVIAYTDLDAMSDRIHRAIPFFDLLRQLGYLGHAVWIFEGHVSAMAAGCRDADLLIVDDGMLPYLPGNWRSVASRVMRGSEVHVFERKTGALRQLA